MDIHHPYADDAARLGLLFRLPTAPAGPIWVVAGAAGGSVGQAWAGTAERHTLAKLEAESAAAGRCGTVALPGTLDGLTPDQARRALDLVAARLLPGGVLVGHVRHGLSLRILAQAVRTGDHRALFAPMTSRRLVQRLTGAGLQQPKVHYVLPSLDAPMAVLPTQPEVADPHFLRELAASRHSHGLAGYGLRWCVARAGLSGCLQDTLFFWAQKPC